MGRTKTNARKIPVGIRQNLDGWVEFRGRSFSGGMGGYLNHLATEDRDRTLAQDPDLAARYRAFLVGTDRAEELASLEPPKPILPLRP